MEILQHLLDGFAAAITPINLMWALLGCTIGTAVGVLPGIGPATAKKLLQTFGSATQVREADPSELAEVIGDAASRKVLAWRDALPREGQ